MITLSRRDLGVLAGAGLGSIAISAAAERTPRKAMAMAARSGAGALAPDLLRVEDQEAQAKIMRSLYAAVGGSFYGRDPHDLTPEDPANWYRFNPKYVCILYLQFGSDLALSVNHACFEIDPVSIDSDREKLAVAILKAKGGGKLGAVSGYRIYSHQNPHVPHQSGHPNDSEWFEDFGFASQNETFIYIDNPRVTLQNGDLIEFKLFGVGNVPKFPNYSYFHAREIVASDLPGKLMAVKNYMTDENGRLLTTDKRLYSMNIKFRVPAGAAGSITMLIDPDTGNGAGNEP